jgi:hypothetical protein
MIPDQVRDRPFPKTGIHFSGSCSNKAGTHLRRVSGSRAYVAEAGLNEKKKSPVFRNDVVKRRRQRPHGDRVLERFPLQVNRKALQQLMLGRIFCGKPVPTFPENALEDQEP